MSDELTNYLMDGSRHAALSPESLELMGKQAANRFLQEGIALNESICKLAGEHNDINGDQVKRIAEFANNAVYLAKHDQSKTAGAESSYPQFQLADPGRIIQEMSDGARPTVTTSTDVEYSRLSEKSKTASIKVSGIKDNVIETMFGMKTAGAPETTRTQAITQVANTKDELLGLKADLENKAEQYVMAHKEASAEYYDLVKRHLLEGNSFSDVLAAAQSSGAEKQKVAEALHPTISRLLTEKVASPVRLQVMTEQLEKVAHRVVNENHPFVSTFRSMLSLEAEIEKVAAALKDVDTELSRVNGFLKEQLLARTAR